VIGDELKRRRVDPERLDLDRARLGRRKAPHDLAMAGEHLRTAGADRERERPFGVFFDARIQLADDVAEHSLRE
jgi:hypothetical protein